jgi:hypothetical protein
VYDAKQLLEDVARMVEAAKRAAAVTSSQSYETSSRR